MDEITKALYLLILPLIAANVLHMLVVKYGFLQAFAKPIWTWAFGENKTWRAFVVLPFLSALFAWLVDFFFGPFGLVQRDLLLLGFGLGMAYLLFELPNSFIKRRLGIASGERSSSYPGWQLFFDKSDSLIGILLWWWYFMEVSGQVILLIFFLSLSLHLSLSYLLFRLKLKSEW